MNTELFQLARNNASISLLVVHLIFTNEAVMLINKLRTFPLTGLTNVYLK
jgi:hypothetical protein